MAHGDAVVQLFIENSTITLQQVTIVVFFCNFLFCFSRYFSYFFICFSEVSTNSVVIAITSALLVEEPVSVSEASGILLLGLSEGVTIIVVLCTGHQRIQPGNIVHVFWPHK